jgi:multiple antibiotic resistance protein
VSFSQALSFSLVAFSAIFFVVDPIAAVPIFVTMTQNDSAEKKRKMALKACVVAACVLIGFALFGSAVFKVFGVTMAAFKIAGGVLLGMTSIDMVRSKRAATRTSDEEIEEGAAKDDIAIVPLGMPVLAGPGSIATVMVLTGQTKAWWQMIPISLSIVLTLVLSYLMLRAASYVDRLLGRTGRAVFERVTGLLLAALSVQFVLGGIREAFP